MSSNSGETIKQLCLDQGIACLSDFMVNAEIAAGTFAEVLAHQSVPVEMPFNAVLLQRFRGEPARAGLY